MHELLQAVILGLVEGLTEFLPVSSTGHLIIANTLLGGLDDRIKSFDIIVQLGAILAVVVLYWPRYWGILFPKKNSGFSGLRALGLLFLTCLPASLLALLVGSFIHDRLFNAASVSLALAVGAVFILLVEKFKGKKQLTEPAAYVSLDEITPGLALGIGFFQCLSLWPGFSRSASTIMGGMILGADRKLAAEYSFIAAVPIMVAATGYELLKSSSQALNAADIPFFAVGLGVAFLSALGAIKIFMSLISRFSFAPFAWYRLILAPVVYFFLSNSL